MIKNWPELSNEILSIVPPYAMDIPPAGLGMLNGYLVQNGEEPCDIVDLRLWYPSVYAPTYRAIGPHAEAFVMDVPDMPLILSLLQNFRNGGSLTPKLGPWFDDYCSRRGIDGTRLSKWLLEIDQYLSEAANRVNAGFFGFSVWTSNLYTTLLFCAYLKRKKHPPFIVLGGPQVTESERSAALPLQAGIVDTVIRGEGEHAFLDVIKAFRGGHSERHTPGSLRWINGELKKTSRPLLKMTDLPLGYYDNMALQSYQTHYRPRLGLPFQLSRGCTDKCSFCSEWVFWEKFRLSKVDQTLDQVEYLIAKYNVTHLRMVDSLLNGTMKHLRKFVEGLLSRNIEITWSGFMRADMDTEMAKLLKRAGFTHAFVGVESLNDETLSDMNKRMTAEDNIRSVTNFLENDISVRAGVIPGYPGDTLDGFERTVTGLLKFREQYPSLFSAGMEPFIVSPGQPLFSDLAGNGLQGTEWSGEIIDLDPESAAITAGAFETVSGRNQGTTRKAMLKALEPLDKIENAWPSETVESFELQRFQLTESSWLLRRKCIRRGLLGYIVTKSELELIAFAARKEGWVCLPNSEIETFLLGIEHCHTLFSSSDGLGISHRYLKETENIECVRHGPNTICRNFDNHSVFVDYRSLVAVTLRSGAAAKMGHYLADGAQTPIPSTLMSGLRELGKKGLVLNHGDFDLPVPALVAKKPGHTSIKIVKENA